MEKLEALSSIARLSEHVVRILGQNPGKFTLQGTNTYLIGKRRPYTLIDTGEGLPQYLPVLERALLETVKDGDKPEVSDIIISHWHGDHIGGLPSVLSLLSRLWKEHSPTVPFKPPRLHKFPLPNHTITPSRNSQFDIQTFLASLPPDLYTPSPSGSPFHDLQHSQVLSPSGLHIIHTPGHTDDSICLYIPEDEALYTADTVLGQGTAVFEDLAAYMSSLQKMLQFGESQGTSYTNLYPGHGPVVTDGPKLISSYIKHRKEREDQIVDLLHKDPSSIIPITQTDTIENDLPRSPIWSTWAIVKVLYAAYPENLWLPAAHSVHLHLLKLEGEGRAKNLGGEGKDMEWQLV